jgi:uncharacterized phage protein (TIGR02218 family)
MPKDIDVNYVKYLFKPGITLLTGYAFSLSTSYDYCYVANNKNIVVNPYQRLINKTFTALAIKRSTIKSEEGTILNELEIGLDNADLSFKNDVMMGKYTNRRCTVSLIFVNPKSTTALGYMDLFEGYLDEPKGDEHWITFQMRPFSIFEREFPNRIFQVGCNWSFCDDLCTLDINDYTVNTTLDSESNGAVLACSHGQVANYFVPGYVKITSGTYIDLYRPILANDTSSVTLRVPFGFTIPIGTSLKVVKMCARNPTACIDVFNNYVNYGGFPHTPKAPLL